jgi:hypothetical protein
MLVLRTAPEGIGISDAIGSKANRFRMRLDSFRERIIPMATRAVDHEEGYPLPWG